MFAASLTIRSCKLNILKCCPKTYTRPKIQSISVRQKQISFNFRQKVEKDVVLYELEKPTYFKFVTAFSVLQCAFWTHLGIFLYQRVHSFIAPEDKPQKSFWLKILDDSKYVNILSVVSLLFGWTLFLGTCFYNFRSIRKLILNKGGKTVTIITYNIPGLNCINQLPLGQVSSVMHRTHAKKYLPLKVKNKYFYYLLDTRGHFNNPELFDFTAGINRNI